MAFVAFGCSDASLKTFNAEPKARITSHAADEALLEEVTTRLRGTVSDPDHDEADLVTTWRVNGETICEDVVPQDDGTTSCTTTLSTGAVTVVLEVSDLGNATDSDSISFTVTPNAPPDVSLTDPFEGERYYADEAIEFKGRVTDEEDSFDSLTVRIESDIQGALDLNTTLNSEGRFSDFGSLDAGTHVITITATDSGGKTGRDQEEVEVLPGNSAPTIASVEITPDPATATAMLSCIISGYEDADGDADESEYEWTVNGTVAGTNETLSDAFVGGDEVVCTVVPSDGDDSGDPLSDSIVISNSVPQIETVEITPDPAVGTDILTCTYTGFSDADGHEDGSTYAWTINESDAGTESTLSEGFGVGDTVTCTVTPNDGTEDGEPASDSVVIANTAPEVEAVVITPDAGVNSSTTLSCAASFTDADGEELMPAYSWTLAGVDAGDTDTLVLTPAIASPGDEVVCTASASDASGDTATGTDSVTVANTAPEITVTIESEDDPPIVTSILTCVADATDADGETVTLDYSWTIDGAPTGDTDTLVLTPDSTGTDSTVVCTVTATDTSGATAEDSAEITVANTAPEMLDVIIEPGEEITTSTTLTCEATWTDADGEDLVPTYSWTRADGTDFGTEAVLSLAPLFASPGDVYTCTATITDGEGASASGSDSATVGNTAPNVLEVVITPGTGVTATTALTCAATAEDADGDVPSITYAWDIDGFDVGTGSSLDLATTAAVSGETVTCTATATDSPGATDTGTDNVIIENTAPEVDSVTLSPDPVYTNDTITATVSTVDVEDDAVTVTYAWYVNDSLVASGATLSGVSYFDKHDEVYVVVTPSDGTDDGEALASDTIAVLNTPPTSPVVLIGEGGGMLCSEGWTEMPDGDRCIQVNTDELTWLEAEGQCAAAGGTLVSIGSEEGNTFLYEHMLAASPDFASMWAGYTDVAAEGTWTWTDGSSGGYTNWYSDEPNNRYEDEHCMLMRGPGRSGGDGQWNDHTCDGTRDHIGVSICQTAPAIDPDGLTCIIETASTDDDDDDTVTYTFGWDVDGATYTDTDTTTEDGDTVLGDALGYDETWTCTVTPDDGEEEGASGSDSYYVEAAEPAEEEPFYTIHLDSGLVASGLLDASILNGVPLDPWIHGDSTAAAGSADWSVDYINVYDSCDGDTPTFTEEFDSLSGWSITAKGGVGSVHTEGGNLVMTSDYNQVDYDSPGDAIGPDGFRVEVRFNQGAGSAGFFVRGRTEAGYGYDINYQPRRIWGGKGADWTAPMVSVQGEETAIGSAPADGWHTLELCVGSCCADAGAVDEDPLVCGETSTLHSTFTGASGKKYYYCQDDGINYADARSGCDVGGQHLVSLDTTTSQSEAMSALPFFADRYWIGLSEGWSECNGDGVYCWYPWYVASAHSSLGDTNWAPGEPLVARGRAWLQSSSGLWFSDGDTTLLQGFICQDL